MVAHLLPLIATTGFMTDLELQQLRREKWRLDGKAIRTIEQARAFLEDVGFCLMYPQRPTVLVPTFIGAFVGSDDRLPGWQHAFADPRAAEATELMVRLLRERTAFEANRFDENNGFLLAASVFPYFYALTGERNPKLAPRAGTRSPYSQPRSTRRWRSCGRSCGLRASTTGLAKARCGTCCIGGRRRR